MRRDDDRAAWPHCWCGEIDLEPFGPEYSRCRSCGTLVSNVSPPPSAQGVQDDACDFYGESYGDEHQTGLGLPKSVERMRADLSERCCYWLETLLRYRRPPGTLLELGCAHGASTKLFQVAGFAAIGVEMSPAVVARAKKHFAIDFRVGPLNRLTLFEPLDIVVSFDVLEHLRDPVETLRGLRGAMRGGGLLLIQTPEANESSFERAVADGDRYLEHLHPGEHVYLFTKRAMTLLLERTGFPVVIFETPLYDYDMFLAASDEPLDRVECDPQGVLDRTGDERIVQALLDAVARERSYRDVATERLRVIDELKAACDERLALIETLDRALHDRDRV